MWMWGSEAVGRGVPTSAGPSVPPQSRLVRDQVPYFIWTTRGSAVQSRVLQPDQVVNHYGRVGSFTTKVGPRGTHLRGMEEGGRGSFLGGCHPSLRRRGCASPCGTCPGSTKPTPTPSSPAATGWAPRTSARPSSVSSGLARPPRCPPPCVPFPRAPRAAAGWAMPPLPQRISASPPRAACSKRHWKGLRRCKWGRTRPQTPPSHQVTRGGGLRLGPHAPRVPRRGAAPRPSPRAPSRRGPGCPAGGGGAAGVRAAPGQPLPPRHRRRPPAPRHHRRRLGRLPTGLLPRCAVSAGLGDTLGTPWGHRGDAARTGVGAEPPHPPIFAARGPCRG